MLMVGFSFLSLSRWLTTDYCLFFFNDTASTEIYTLSLHDALPILAAARAVPEQPFRIVGSGQLEPLLRSEEHTSELQSRVDLVCRLLLEKKNTTMESRTGFTIKRLINAIRQATADRWLIVSASL